MVALSSVAAPAEQDVCWTVAAPLFLTARVETVQGETADSRQVTRYGGAWTHFGKPSCRRASL